VSKYIIIGGGAGGAAAAARLRRLDEKAEIIIFERTGYISSANCGLPYYIGCSIKKRDKLLVRTPEDFLARFNIQVKLGFEVTGINRDEKSVTAVNSKDGTVYTETYDFCILSPGAEPVLPPIPGIDSEGIFTLRTIPDCDRIKEFVSRKGLKKALVVGAGFIGMEMAENFYDLGLDVTIVEMADQVLSAADWETASVIQFHLKCKNVRFYTSERVVSIEKCGDSYKAHLQSGKSVSSDIIVISAGVRPEVQLAVDASLEIGASRAIKVDSFMRTNDHSIYALGDAVETYHPATDSCFPCYLAGPAAKQARVVANNIVRGNTRRYSGSLGTAIAKIFDLTIARTGATEAVLKRSGIRYSRIIDNPYNHAGYYPYPRLLFQKLLFCPITGKILGASAVGIEGVDKRIDIISAVMGMNGTIRDLANFEQAYAPPFSSAKDPVNMLGFMAENCMDGLVAMVSAEELSKTEKCNITLLDVRSEEEYERGCISGAVNIPIDGFRERIKDIPGDKPVYVYCEAGLRAYIACRILLQNGFEEVYDLTGGYASWQFFNQPRSFEPKIHDPEWKVKYSSLTNEKGNTVDISPMNNEEIALTVKTELASMMEDDFLFLITDTDESAAFARETVEKHGHEWAMLSEKDPFVIKIRKI